MDEMDKYINEGWEIINWEYFREANICPECKGKNCYQLRKTINNSTNEYLLICKDCNKKIDSDYED